MIAGDNDPTLDPLETLLTAAALPGLTRPAAAKLANKRIRTVRDLLEQTPRRYIDLSHTRSIGDLKIGEEATILGEVKSITARRLRAGRHMLILRIGDGTGFVEAVWWNQPFRERMYAKGMQVAAAGRFEGRSGRIQIQGPFFVEKVEHENDTEGVHTRRIIPVHPTTEGVSATMLRRAIHAALRSYGPAITDPLPRSVRDRLDLDDRSRALAQIHFPASQTARARARKRLAFEELFVLSTGLGVRKRRIERETPGIAQPSGREQVDAFLEALPYRPTGAQRRAITEILGDMARPIPMHRLLQGEVGSGKTLVAVAAAVAAAANGCQTALMAPTEVLAEQHFSSISRLLSLVPHLAGDVEQSQAEAGQLSLTMPGFRVELLTGSVTGKSRERAAEAARSGAAHLLIGTHALIQDDVAFARLGLAIVDEQHRFGVHQRLALRGKGPDGVQPDVLIMTATPIPRTLALTLYGDLDVSVLDEMPPGRASVRTKVLTADKRAEAEELIRSEVAKGHQAFIVCPLVEQSATKEAKAAQSEYERVANEAFPNLRVALLHGRMKPAEKEEVMRHMRAGEIDVLVATTVIEVGVDIANATVMIVEDADRFGLSQLHQLRGRIGRSEHPSTCVLMSSLDPLDEASRVIARKRLDAMQATNDGFHLAEVDLELRGEGQIFGRGAVEYQPPQSSGANAPAQAGATDLRFASLLRDQELLVDARREAFAVVDDDPHLAKQPALLAEVRRRFADRLDWLFAG